MTGDAVPTARPPIPVRPVPARSMPARPIPVHPVAVPARWSGDDRATVSWQRVGSDGRPEGSLPRQGPVDRQSRERISRV